MSALAQLLSAEGVEIEAGPTPIARPRDEEGLGAVLARAAEQGARVVPMGNGGRLSWCRPEVAAGQADLLLSTASMAQVLDYVPGDGTLTAQAGCTMAQLGATVAAGGHLLTPSVALPEQATLGGTLAAGHSGLDRVRFGPVRHHVLGARVLLADGSAPRSGGKLVKNVTGFDLHRLYTGSRGTLCVLLEASLRLFPLPERVLHLVWRAGSLADQLERARGLQGLFVKPLEELLTGANDDWSLHLTLAGLEPQVREEQALVTDAAGAPDELLQDDDAAAERARLRDLEASDGWPQLSATGRPTATASMVHALTDLGAERLVVQPRVAQALAWIPRLDASPETLRRLRGLRRYERGSGLRIEPRALPFEFHRELAPRVGEAPGLGWMNSLRTALDPEGRFASPTFPGRS